MLIDTRVVAVYNRARVWAVIETEEVVETTGIHLDASNRTGRRRNVARKKRSET